LSEIKAGAGQALAYELTPARPMIVLGSCQQQEKGDGKRDVSEMATGVRNSHLGDEAKRER
jgi:hypothetical protein